MGEQIAPPKPGKRRKYDNPRVIRGAPAREVHSLTPLTVKIDQFNVIATLQPTYMPRGRSRL